MKRFVTVLLNALSFAVAAAAFGMLIWSMMFQEA